MSDTHISDAHISRPIAGASSAALETVSLRRRVTIATLSLLAATLAILGVVVALALRERLLADLRSTMIAKARLASSLAVSLSPQQLADRLSSAQVVARVTSNGVTFTGVPRPPGGQPVGRSDARGSRSNQLAGGSRAVVPPVRAPLHPLPPPAVVDYGSVLSVTRQLGQGTKVVLSASRSSIEATVTHLEVIEVVSSLGVMVVAGLALRKVVGAALSPLDQVVEVASSIAAGNSGQRLRPLRTDTELGRMAASSMTWCRLWRERLAQLGGPRQPCVSSSPMLPMSCAHRWPPSWPAQRPCYGRTHPGRGVKSSRPPWCARPAVSGGSSTTSSVSPG